MAKAPAPGGRRQQDELDQTFRIRIVDETFTIRVGDLNTEDHLAVQKATGLPVEAFLREETFGRVGVAVLVFLARRKAGEWGLKWKKFVPEFDALWAQVKSADDVELLEDDDEDEGGADPLGSAAT